ncbi:hypothetical protein Tco_1090045 [Tanacetum coccineum]|uniref:Uncharacterized protein n=1 Tax=Tanacetum coccineum TaxID=301880 RepID=A0ABQ5I4Q6_9ASTR
MVDIMADLNILANDAPMEQAPAPQRNPIFPIVVALLKNTNLFRDFTASSMIPAIYIQQFWDTMCFNTSTRLYSCQLDEQWFNLHKDILRDALDITPTNDNNPFVALPSSDTVIEYVNTPRYPSMLKNVSAMSVNALYQPWRAVLSMINMCLMGKTVGKGDKESSDATNVTKPKAAKVTKPLCDKLQSPPATQPPETQTITYSNHQKRPQKNKNWFPMMELPMRTDKELIRQRPRTKLKAWLNPVMQQVSPSNQVIGVHAGPNREHMDLEATIASSQQKPEQMDEEFTTTAYPNVQENLKLPTEEEKNAEIEVQSMVSVPIHQDTSSVSPMTTPVIDLRTMQSDSLLPRSTTTTSIITTTTAPSLQPLNQTKHHRILSIKSHSQAVDEIVTDAVDWAMQAPLRARFRDLPTVDMKEILQQLMFEDNSYKAHELSDKKARKKKRKKRAAPRTPSGSLPSPPPPPPPLAGASGALGISGTSRSSQLPPPPLPPSTGTSGSAQQQGNDSIPDKHVHLSDDEDSRNDHLPKADSRQDWWKPLPEEERPATSEPAWTFLLLM